MAVEVHTVFKINLVLVGLGLLNTEEDTNKFIRATGSEAAISVFGAIQGATALPEQGRRMEFHLDRILVDLLPNLTKIEKAYPTSKSADIDRLSEFIELAIENTDLNGATPTAFGYNIELAYDQTSGGAASAYLGKRLFSDSSWGMPGWDLVGGSGRMIFDSASGRWTVILEPRFQDAETPRLFLNLNLHKADSYLPTTEEIRVSLAEIWEQAILFTHHIDGGGLQ